MTSFQASMCINKNLAREGHPKTGDTMNQTHSSELEAMLDGRQSQCHTKVTLCPLHESRAVFSI